jgi:hypothetical protein
MRYLLDEIWSRLSLADFRPRFFVETYVEKLSVHTPHFYQSRLMSVLSSCAEIVAYIEECKASERNRGYLLSGLDEFESALQGDPIAQDLVATVKDPRQELFRVIRGGDFSIGKLNRLKVLCEAMLGWEEEYFTKLLAALRQALIGPTDLTAKDRITKEIYLLTGIYTTHLLNKGYSPTYLFNRAEQFTRPGNYSGRSFDLQFQFVTERLQSAKVSFDVYYAIHANRPSAILDIKDDGDFTFYDALPAVIHQQHVDKLTKDFNFNIIARATIQSTDHVSAAWRVKEKLDKLLDVVTALQLNPRIRTSPHCVVISHLNPTAGESFNIDLLISFLSSESGTYFSGAEASIRSAVTRLDLAGRERLSRSLRYLRLARESVSLEQKLLNLWIALESLFSDGEAGALSSTVEYVPQIYAMAGIRRRVTHLRDLLVRNDVPTTAGFRAKAETTAERFDTTISESQVFLLLRDQALAIELFNGLGDREHLKFKLLQMFRELKTNADIAERLKRSEIDVARQLRRIYFLRNKMAHSGHYGNIRPQLVTHLLDYVANSYMAITDCARHVRPGNLHSIGDLLAGYKLGADVVASRCQSGSQIQTMDELIPTPII